MRSQAGNSTLNGSSNRAPESNRVRAIALGAALASFALTSCTAEQERLAQLRPAPYFALAASSGPDANARRSGTFAEANGCVVFRPADDSPMMTPVFPKGETALVTDGTDWLGFYVRGAPVAMGEVYRLYGAQPASDGGVALAAPVPAGCPSRYFVVHSVGKALADANVSRFCAGVIICRSFGLD